MRLYTCAGQSAYKDPETGEIYTADDLGGFEFPDDLGERLLRFHIGKQRQWEDDEQRHQRVISEEAKRAQDPATLLAVVQQMAALVSQALPAQPAVAKAEAVQPAEEPAPAPEAPAATRTPAKRAAKRTAAAPTAE